VPLELYSFLKGADRVAIVGVGRDAGGRCSWYRGGAQVEAQTQVVEGTFGRGRGGAGELHLKYQTVQTLPRDFYRRNRLRRRALGGVELKFYGEFGSKF